MSKPDVLDVLSRGRQAFSLAEWLDFLLRSIGLEPAALTTAQRRWRCLRMVPFVERNYNTVELGPRGTARVICSSRSSPYAHLLSV